MKNKNTEKGFLAGVIISTETGRPTLSEFLSRGVEENWFGDMTNRNIFKAVLS